MRILFFCPNFYPKTGGLEHIALYLAEDLQKKGNDVRLITYTALGTSLELQNGVSIIRNPSLFELFKNYLWCTIYFHHNISLKGLFPILIYPFKKWVVLHHLTYFNHGKITVIEQIKRQFSRFTYNISCSQFVNNTLPKRGKVILNAYDDNCFFKEAIEKNKFSIVFVGRLVSDKGCALLLKAIKIVLLSNSNIKLTIVGEGPELNNLQQLIVKYKLENSVLFKGTLKGKELRNELNKNEIICVPSIWEEPFGIVALEGIACDCIPVYTKTGGLPEACIDIGVGFESHNANDLSSKILSVFNNYDTFYSNLLTLKEAHLSQFKRENVVTKFDTYLRSSFEN